MWKVYSDSWLLYSTNLEEYQIYNPSLSLELNKTGSFSFTIYPKHPNYDKIDKLKSIITVYQDDYLYFRGRVLNDTLGFYNERSISCEGELAFLLDSIQRPFNFPANQNDVATPEAYFAFLIQRHNAQVPVSHQFVVGTVTVTDPNNYISRSDTEYENTWDLINDGLIETHGGYLWVDYDADNNRRINYYSDFSFLSNQKIEFGSNLLSLSTERRGEDIATAIVPLGYADEETNERLTISGLSDETTDDICKFGDIVYSKSAETLYGGRITKVVEWDSVTDASNLLRKAKEQLAKSVLQTNTIELSAADLSAAGYDVNGFRLGTYVITKSNPHSDAHGLANRYLVKKLTIKLDNPAMNELTLGSTVYTFTEQNKRDIENELQTLETNVTLNQAQALRELELRTSSVIQQLPGQIVQTVSKDYYDKNQTDVLVSSVSTSLEQTERDFTLRFENIETSATTDRNATDSRFSELNKYIRFEDGNIVLGEVGNTQTQVITNTRNEFREGNAVVAYIGNRKLYITDGEFLTSLRLGKFEFQPRQNGNLSFRKVVD